MTPIKKTGLNLFVTVRPNVKASSGWTQMLLDDYLDFLQQDRELIKQQEKIISEFIEMEALGNEQAVDDLIIHHQFLHEKKAAFRLHKLELPCVQYFGKFIGTPESIILSGDGNGLVVLDIDLKEVGSQLPSSFLEKQEGNLSSFFYSHQSAVFLYHTVSTLGYHLGFYSDAKTPEQYKIVFKSLVQELKKAYPLIGKYVDESVGQFNRCFFASHSPLVLRKKPKALYLTSDVTEILPFEKPKLQVHDNLPETKKITAEQATEYHPFPTQEDFRLFLAFTRRNKNKNYFHEYEDWITMIYCLKAFIPICYRERLEYWFTRLSALSPKYNAEEDRDTFEDVLHSDGEKRSGVAFIIKHLADGEEVSQYQTYSLDEVEHYFKTLADHDKGGKVYDKVLFVHSYLTEVHDRLPLQENLWIDAPPGSGKSSFFLECFQGKRIFLVPTLVLLYDLKKKIQDGVVYEIVSGDKSPGDIKGAELILSTYEGLHKIVNSSIEIKEYSLIMDEAHNLFVSASPKYRFAALNTIVSSMRNFKNVILLSGTPIDFPFSYFKFTHIKVEQRNTPTQHLEIVTTPNPLNSLVEDCLQETGKQIVLINNREENRRVKALIEKYRPGALVTIINSDTKNDPIVLERMRTNRMQNGEILIGTQSLVEGISLLDDDIKAIRYYQKQLPELITQLAHRARSSAARPVLRYYTARQNFKLSACLDYSEVYKKLNSQYKAIDPSSLSRELIDGTQLMRYYVEEGKGKRKTKDYTPFLSGKHIMTKPSINLLLLGNLVLLEIGKAFNSDLFSMLYHLRKRNFIFSFSQMGVSTVREDFRNLLEDDQRELIRDKFETIWKIAFEDLNKVGTDHIFKAWHLLQHVQAEFFVQMAADEREHHFMDQKRFSVFVEEMVGFALKQGKTFSALERFVSKKFKEKDTQVLLQIKDIPGYPDKIFHHSLKERFGCMGLSIQGITSILKQQFDVAASVPTTIDGKAQRYISLQPRSFAFEEFLKMENMVEFGSSPF